MNMNKIIKLPFEAAEIEIIKMSNVDVITASPTGPNPFPGEDDEFDPLYWE